MNEKMDELIDTRAMLDPKTSRAVRFHYMFHGIMRLISDDPADVALELEDDARHHRHCIAEVEPGEDLEWHSALARLAELAREIALRRSVH
jgi:hypothetical protein